MPLSWIRQPGGYQRNVITQRLYWHARPIIINYNVWLFLSSAKERRLLTAAITSKWSQHFLLQPGAESVSFKKSHLGSPANCGKFCCSTWHFHVSVAIHTLSLTRGSMMNIVPLVIPVQKIIFLHHFSLPAFGVRERRGGRETGCFLHVELRRMVEKIPVYIHIHGCHLCSHTGLFFPVVWWGVFLEDLVMVMVGNLSRSLWFSASSLQRDFRELNTCLPVLMWHSGPGLMQPRHPKWCSSKGKNK